MKEPVAMGRHENPGVIRYNRFLLLVAGLGGLLYGVDVGIIAGALPYLEETSGLNAGQLSIIVSAVLLGTVFGTLFAGMLADLLGRKTLMILSGMLFAASIPMIALAHGFGPLFFGRLLQGVSGGLIGVVVPLYLAECLGAGSRGRGTAVFQWLLTLGIVIAAIIGMYFSYRVASVEKIVDEATLLRFKDAAWRSIFWVSLPPGILFVIGAFFVAESPRWLFRQGRREASLAALLRSRSSEQASMEFREIEVSTASETSSPSPANRRIGESLLKRKYVIPFAIACVILACNQATGINSIIGYNATILIQAGLSDLAAHWGYAILTMVNFLMTIVAVLLVDRKGRKFLLSIGSAGIIVSLVAAGILFGQTEKHRVDRAARVQAMVTPDQTLTVNYDAMTAKRLYSRLQTPDAAVGDEPTSLILIYSCGGFRAASRVVRSSDATARPLEITREGCVPRNGVVAFFTNPFVSLDAARNAPLKIENAFITPIPDAKNGWKLAICLYVFMSFFAIGPGVCVWLALSELMPTRIRSNGMSIALLINQAVSTSIAAVFLPAVGKYGYSTLFYLFAGCTVVYFITATFFLPETKGKTLEEIEALFAGKRSAANDQASPRRPLPP
ncbi:MAG: MFS transporter [Chitinispirillaceae bacterium]|nr:MFS transporter [Chitinispirillaceae bacterium]